jgi:hypothetical protein
MSPQAGDQQPEQMPATGRRVWLGRALILALASSACHHAPLPPVTPQAVRTAPYPQGPETAVADRAVQEGIYRAVLQFYRPGPGQSRWLDPQLLPSAPADTERVMDAALAHRLVAAMGRGSFCLLHGPGCAHTRGGVLHLSLPYATGPDVARVIVRFEGLAGPYAPGTAFSGTEVFVLVRVGNTWKIHAHSSAPGR